jgi:hypothetical protein
MSAEQVLVTALGTCLFGAITFVLQAAIRGTWIPKSTVNLLLGAKDELLHLKDGQIGLLTVEKEAWKTTAEKQGTQISLFAEASQTTKHFFQEVPVVPSKGDTDEKSEA